MMQVTADHILPHTQSLYSPSVIETIVGVAMETAKLLQVLALTHMYSLSCYVNAFKIMHTLVYVNVINLGYVDTVDYRLLVQGT